METDYYYGSFEDDWFDHRRKLTKEEENEWLRSYYERQKQDEKERYEFPVSINLTLGDLDQILSDYIPKDLRKKLESARQHAEHSFRVRNVDFGDLEED